MIDKLEEYAQLEGTEWGEYLLALCEVARYDYMAPEYFNKALKRVIELEYKHISNKYKIVRTQELVHRTELEEQ